MSEERMLRMDVVATARAMNKRGLNQGTSGNVSVRHGDGFLITPSGVPYEDMAEEMIVPTAFDGAYVGSWTPSSEWRLHADIYRTRPAVQAVVHTHSMHATALSTLRLGIPPFHYMVAVAGGPDIRCADYATFGTPELSDAMLEALDGRAACLLANHGQIATGASLAAALSLAEEVETLARQYILARQVGEPVLIDADEMVRVLAKFSTYGQRP